MSDKTFSLKTAKLTHACLSMIVVMRGDKTLYYEIAIFNREGNKRGKFLYNRLYNSICEATHDWHYFLEAC